MTRMAPKPTDYARRADAAITTKATLRWRIGRGGSLVLSIGRCDDELVASAAHASDGLSVRVEIHRCPLIASRAAGAAPSATEVLSGRLQASGDHCKSSLDSHVDSHLESRLELSLCRGDAMLGAQLSLVERTGGAPLVLTDLPMVLGLRGGTYKLAESEVDGFAAALQTLLAGARA